ncbi:MAG: hypothetical protein SXG53_13120 [Pseudomonadota bacterium]|nr:hypothetical protein [Pseudomonadota bacterium]
MSAVSPMAVPATNEVPTAVRMGGRVEATNPGAIGKLPPMPKKMR